MSSHRRGGQCRRLGPAGRDERDDPAVHQRRLRLHLLLHQPVQRRHRRPARTSATARIDARFELFAGGRKFATLSQTGADLESARATEEQQRFLTALDTEADFYSVLSNHELVDVSRDRVRRAEEQLVVARARVMSGAAVQTDSLQILELNRARVGCCRMRPGLG